MLGVGKTSATSRSRKLQSGPRDERFLVGTSELALGSCGFGGIEGPQTPPGLFGTWSVENPVARRKCAIGRPMDPGVMHAGPGMAPMKSGMPTRVAVRPRVMHALARQDRGPGNDNCGRGWGSQPDNFQSAAAKVRDVRGHPSQTGGVSQTGVAAVIDARVPDSGPTHLPLI
jgi:hypothetical protein